jgi:phage tail-like protein
MGDGPAMSNYLQHLPAVLQQGPFLGRLLLAFEAVLSGFPEGEAPSVDDPAAQQDLAVPGLEQLIAGVSACLAPTPDPDGRQAPEDFLPWLAQWAAASLRDDWSEATKRAFLAEVIPLYKRRGTRAGMECVLRLCVGDVAVSEIDRQDTTSYPLPFLVGDPPLSWLGYDDGVRAHHFRVVLRVALADPAELARKARQVREIVDREKPAHTTYSLRVEYPAMKLTAEAKRDEHHVVTEGVVIGETTVLGNIAANPDLIKGR